MPPQISAIDTDVVHYRGRNALVPEVFLAALVVSNEAGYISTPHPPRVRVLVEFGPIC